MEVTQNNQSILKRHDVLGQKIAPRLYPGPTLREDVDLTSGFVECLGWQIHFKAWGDKTKQPLVLWHGSTGNTSYFDHVAPRLAQTHWVIVPDNPGHGLSSWAHDPSLYSIEHCAEVAEALLNTLDIDQCDWFGTSLGGLIGIVLAGGALKNRFRKFVINDIPPFISAADLKPSKEDLERLDPSFDTLEGLYEDLGQHLKKHFGMTNPSLVNHIVHHSYRRDDAGKIRNLNDPRILNLAGTEDMNFWGFYEAITCDVLIYWGKQSYFLTQSMVDQMLARNKRANFSAFNNVGHAPALDTEEQVEILEAFLSA